jgi:hypothetical protein
MISRALVTLRTNNYAPEIWEYTEPLFKFHAFKHNLDFIVIDQRKFPEVPCENYEKFQTFEIAQAYDKTLFVDADALIHPDCFDWLALLSDDHVLMYGRDLATSRFRDNLYFRRDGRYISACTWFVGCTRDTAELWTPMLPHESFKDDIVDQIYPIMAERQARVFEAKHLCDDYILSRNIARFGLRYMNGHEFVLQHGLQGLNTIWHNYNVPEAQKLAQIQEVYVNWGLKLPDTPEKGPSVACSASEAPEATFTHETQGTSNDPV